MTAHRAAGSSVSLCFLRLSSVGLFLGAAILLAGFSVHPVGAKPFMIVGLDEKVLWDADGKPVLAPDGKDAVLIVDLASPESPKIAASLPLKNSVIGPPVNVDIDPTGSIALVADSVDIVKDGDAKIDAAQADWVNGAKQAYANILDSASNVAGQTDTLFTSAFNNIGDALANFATTGKLNFKGFVNSVLTDLARM